MIKRILSWLTNIVFLLVLLTPSISKSAQERRIALVIGNGTYKSSPLRNPLNDANDMAVVLRKLGFSVQLKVNADQRSMEDSIRTFGKELRSGGIGLFYYAGHGLQVDGRNYLIPIGADIESEADVKYESVDAGRVLAQMDEAENSLNIIILDACRDNPFARSFRSGQKGLAKMDAPTGSILAYSTAPGSIAADGIGRNGLYTSYLLMNMMTPGLKIEDMFKQVRIGVSKESGKKQIPWESSSLMGEFYFTSKRGISVEKVPTAKTSSIEVNTGLTAERNRLEQERMELERLKMEIERERLNTERKRIEAEKKKLFAKKTPKYASISPDVSKPKVIERDGRFVAYDNETVKDTKTGLMWASKDNGEDINWKDAKRYCESYRGGGYTDWRMPTQDELAGIYGKNMRGYKQDCGSWFKVKLTKLIHITCDFLWASETRGSRAIIFFFTSGQRSWGNQSNSSSDRALPVRGGN